LPQRIPTFSHYHGEEETLPTNQMESQTHGPRPRDKPPFRLIISTIMVKRILVRRKLMKKFMALPQRTLTFSHFHGEEEPIPTHPMESQTHGQNPSLNKCQVSMSHTLQMVSLTHGQNPSLKWSQVSMSHMLQTVSVTHGQYPLLNRSNITKTHPTLKNYQRLLVKLFHTRKMVPLTHGQNPFIKKELKILQTRTLELTFTRQLLEWSIQFHIEKPMMSQ
jgi:hypothetical protein